MKTWHLPILAVVCALLWGSAFPGIKYVYRLWGGEDTLAVRLTFAGVRFILAGLFLAPLRGSPLAAVRRDTWKPLLGLALCQTFFQYFFFYNGLSISGGVLGGLIISSISFWWVLLAPLFLKTPPPNRRQWFILLTCAAGITAAVWKPGAGAGDPVAGAGLFTAASISGATGAVFVAILGNKKVRPTHATSLSLFFGGVFLTMTGISGWGLFAELFHGPAVFATVYLAFVSATAFALWNYLVQKYSANILAGYRFLIPLSAVTLSAIFIPGESVGLGTVVGGAVVIAALVALGRTR